VVARELQVDRVPRNRISADTNWRAKSYAITGSGAHTLKWRYRKNGWGTSGSDCGWVDYVQTPVPGDWQTITYTYDPSGRRIAKSYDGQIVAKYLYDGSSLIAEYDGFNTLLRKYIYGPGIDQPICMIDVQHDSEVYYYHFDGLGSVVALTDDSGDTVELYEYSVFGQVAASDSNNPNPFLFTGREFDKETGLYYYRARYYNPYIGRFLQTDPARDGINLYAYCRNRPLCRVDPLGLRNIYYRGCWPTGTANAEKYVRCGPQTIDISFFDAEDLGSKIFGPNGEQTGWTVNGAGFRECADDFIVTAGATKYCMMFDIGNEHGAERVYRYITEIISGLQMNQCTIKNIWFWDHGTVDAQGRVTTEMGGGGSWDATLWSGLADYMRRRGVKLPPDCTLHLMHCNAGSGNQELLKSISDDFGLAVRGTDGLNYFKTPDCWDPLEYYVYDPTYERDGWDLTPGGTIWEAKPGQQPTVVTTP
jgi:RHS repeat-associated protein